VRDAAAVADGIVLAPVAPVPPPADSERERFWRWVDDDRPPVDVGSSLLRTMRHVQTFWDAPETIDVVMLHFDDLKTDLGREMRALADRLAIAVPDDRWPELVAAATFDEMRARAGLLAPNASQGTWRNNERFFNRGTSGQWRDLLDDDDLERYRARVRAIGPPDLVEWIHRGAL
jgi:hypothetical protein